ncbi:hypothetical protein [Halobaculum sp. EA56]
MGRRRRCGVGENEGESGDGDGDRESGVDVVPGPEVGDREPGTRR